VVANNRQPKERPTSFIIYCLSLLNNSEQILNLRHLRSRSDFFLSIHSRSRDVQSTYPRTGLWVGRPRIVRRSPSLSLVSSFYTHETHGPKRFDLSFSLPSKSANMPLPFEIERRRFMRKIQSKYIYGKIVGASFLFASVVSDLFSAKTNFDVRILTKFRINSLSYTQSFLS
jgi:hypothetical protein